MSCLLGSKEKVDVPVMRGAGDAQQIAGNEGIGRKWFVDESDLQFFITRVEGTAPVRADAWEPILQKQVPGELVYRAYRRMLKDIRKTEYLSTSITCDTSPMEVRTSCCGVRRNGNGAILPVAPVYAARSYYISMDTY